MLQGTGCWVQKYFAALRVCERRCSVHLSAPRFLPLLSFCGQYACFLSPFSCPRKVTQRRAPGLSPRRGEYCLTPALGAPLRLCERRRSLRLRRLKPATARQPSFSAPHSLLSSQETTARSTPFTTEGGPSFPRCPRRPRWLNYCFRTHSALRIPQLLHQLFVIAAFSSFTIPSTVKGRPSYLCTWAGNS